jgi:O-antigen ligase
MDNIRMLNFRRMPTYSILCCGFLFFLPIYQKISVICIVLLFIYWVMKGSYRASLIILKDRKSLWILPLFYLLHVVGLFYSVNLDYGIADLQTKFTWLLFPLILTAFNMTDEQDRLKNSFITGCIFAAIFNLSRAAFAFLKTGDLGDLMYSKLSHGIHPAYLSVYFNVAILFILSSVIYSGTIDRNKVIRIFLLLIFIFLLSSRTSTVVAIGSVLLFPVFVYGKEIIKPERIKPIGAFMLITGSMFFLVININNRFSQVGKVIEKAGAAITEETIPDTIPNSTSAHYLAWKNSYLLFTKHPFSGVGTGDIREELGRTYNENGFIYGSVRNLNPHNQFLHTGVILGLPAMAVLLIIFLLPFIRSWKRKYWLFVFFLGIVFLNCMTESLLERQAGIIFFSFFYTVFCQQLMFGRIENLKKPYIIS